MLNIKKADNPPRKHSDVIDIFEQMKLDLEKSHNRQIHRIVKEKKTQVLAIFDSLGMHKYKDKYIEGSQQKLIKKKNLSKHKSSYLKDDKTPIPLIQTIRLNNLESDIKESFSVKKDSDRQWKKNFISSRNTTLQIDTNNNTKTKKFLTKSDFTLRNRSTATFDHGFQSFVRKTVIDEQNEGDDQLNILFKNPNIPLKPLKKVRTVSNFNNFFATSLISNSEVPVESSLKGPKVEEAIVDKIFNNCFENCKNIDIDFKSNVDKYSNLISKNVNFINKSLDKDYYLSKLIPLDMSGMNKKKNDYIFLEGKKFDLGLDLDEDKARRLDKLSYMSPNLAYNFRHHLLNKFNFENSEDLPFKVNKKTAVVKKVDDVGAVHDNISRLLRNSDNYKTKLMAKLDNQLAPHKRKQNPNTKEIEEHFQMLF